MTVEQQQLAQAAADLRVLKGGLSLARWLARNVAHASLQEQTCTGFGTRGNLTDAGCPALAKHRRPLRLHNHHATQHAGSNDRIIDFNQATFLLATKPVGDALAGATDCTLVKGLGHLWKSFAFAKDQPV